MPFMRILYCPTDPEMFMLVVTVHQGSHRCPICSKPTEMLEAIGDQLARAADILELPGAPTIFQRVRTKSASHKGLRVSLFPWLGAAFCVGAPLPPNLPPKVHELQLAALTSRSYSAHMRPCSCLPVFA